MCVKKCLQPHSSYTNAVMMLSCVCLVRAFERAIPVLLVCAREQGVVLAINAVCFVQPSLLLQRLLCGLDVLVLPALLADPAWQQIKCVSLFHIINEILLWNARAGLLQQHGSIDYCWFHRLLADWKRE